MKVDSKINTFHSADLLPKNHDFFLQIAILNFVEFFIVTIS
jgi:hypothetical protein